MGRGGSDSWKVIPFCKDLVLENQDSTKKEPSSWEHNLHFQWMRDAQGHTNSMNNIWAGYDEDVYNCSSIYIVHFAKLKAHNISC